MPFTIRVRVAPADVDDLDHANNTAYLRWAQEVAIAHSQAVGLGVAEYKARGAAFVVTRHEIDYLRPALPGQELEAETRVVAMTAVTAERRTAIRALADGQLLARAVTMWAYIDFARGRPVRIPGDIRSRFVVEPV